MQSLLYQQSYGNLLKYAILAYPKFAYTFACLSKAMRKTIHSKENRILICLLREKREALNITQTQLAKLIGADQTFISKIENSERRLDLVEARTICKALKISFADFVQELETLFVENDKKQSISL